MTRKWKLKLNFAENAIIALFLHQTSWCPDEKQRGPQFTSNIERFDGLSDEKMNVKIKEYRDSPVSAVSISVSSV